MTIQLRGTLRMSGDKGCTAFGSSRLQQLTKLRSVVETMRHRGPAQVAVNTPRRSGEKKPISEIVFCQIK